MSPAVSAPNERTRLYLTLAVVESGSLHIDAQVKEFGKPFDVAKRDGHYYSDKAPGASFLALPAVWLYRVVGGAYSIEQVTNFARTWVMVPFSILSLLLLRHILLDVGVARPIANRTALALLLGTNLFHYGAAFFGHALVTCASLGAAFAILRATHASTPRRQHLWQLLAGFCGGMAFAIEYQAALLCVGIALAYLSIKEFRTLKAILMPALGAALPIALVLVYNKLAFGSPFQTSYGFIDSSFAEVHSHGLFGITLPSMDALYGLIFSPSRGLLLCAPLVALSVLGMRALWRRCRWLAVYVLFGCATYFLTVASFPVWFGGWGFGPRMLIPLYGLAAIATGVFWQEQRDAPGTSTAIRAYLIAGVLYCSFVTAMFPEIPETVHTPLKTVAIPLAALGKPSPNLGMTLLGLDGLWSLAPLVTVVLGFCVFLWRAPESPTRWRVRRLPMLAAILFLFALVTLRYPEPYPQKAADKLIENLASKRIEAR